MHLLEIPRQSACGGLPPLFTKGELKAKTSSLHTYTADGLPPRLKKWWHFDGYMSDNGVLVFNSPFLKGYEYFFF